MSEKLRSHDAKIWILIHACLALILPLSFLGAPSCIKKPELKNAELGSKTSVQDIDAAISEALEDVTPYTSTKTQAVEFVLSYRAETAETEYYQAVVQQMKDIIDNDEEFSLIYDERLYELKKDQSDKLISTKEKEMNFYPKSIGLQSAALTPQSRLPASQIRPDIYKRASQNHIVSYADRQYTDQTFHNLQVNKIIKPAPAAVRAQPDCLGLPQCEIRVTRITYDTALWYSEADFDKVSIETEISSDVPFLGTFISECTVAQQIIGERDYVIRNCSELSNFLF